MRRTLFILPVIAWSLAPACSALAAETGASANIIAPEALIWMPAAGLPPGAEVAVLYGDPAKPGPFALRFKFPAGYSIPTHSHPTDELLTIVSGKARMSFGEMADEASAKPLTEGSFMSLPAGAWHRLWIDADTVIELHSTGPFGVTPHTH